MTLGAKLLESEEQRKAAARQAKGQALIDFFKITCAAEVEAAILENRQPRWLNPPAELRHLFAARLSNNELLNHENPRSEYFVEWTEIKVWAKENGLEVAVGKSDDKLDRVVKPWNCYNWMGTLTAIRPEHENSIVVHQQPKGFWTTLADVIFGKK
jgi:hypothetical protein